MELGIAFVIGAVFGAIIVLVVHVFRRKTAEDAVVEKVKETFRELSSNLFDENSRQLLTLASERLDSQRQLTEKVFEGKKELIDQTFEEMRKELAKVNKFVAEVETDRKEKYAALDRHLALAAQQTNRLITTTSSLEHALASTRVRGQWGEKMAEDILRLVGFVEGVNYLRQKTMDTVRSRPDYTFLLPQGMKVNMDVKFPYVNYLAYCKSEIDSERDRYKKLFLSDVRSRIKEVTTKDYINPEENTVDYVILFIPNDQIYSFVSENDDAIFYDEALTKRVIVCSPLTLFAILSVIRQAIDNFRLEQTASEMARLFNDFSNQWQKYLEKYKTLGNSIASVNSAFTDLTTTRTSQLERVLGKIDNLREDTKLPGIDEPPFALTAAAEGEERDISL